PTSSCNTCTCPWGTDFNGGNTHNNTSGQPSGRNGTPLGSNNSSAPNRLSAQTQNGIAPGIQTGTPSATQPRNQNSPFSAPPASHNRLSPRTGTGSNKVPSSAGGNATKLTQGTAIKLANGPLRLMGRFSASITGNKPRAINHCARVQLRNQLQAPNRPLKISS